MFFRENFLRLLASVFVLFELVKPDEFTCHNGQPLFIGKKEETAAIYPRDNVLLEVGKDTKEVLCRFNPVFINATQVYFSALDRVLPHKIVNDSTIRLQVKHAKPEKYQLHCRLKSSDAIDKVLCTQMVVAGLPPLDITNLSCVSHNNLNLNCTWTEPWNPLSTYYRDLSFAVPGFITKTPCPESNPELTWCFWNNSNRYRLRNEFNLLISAWNKLGEETFTHTISILKIVIPEKVKTSVVLLNATRAKVTWVLPSPMDVFRPGLFHNVEYRIRNEQEWTNVTFFFHKHSVFDFTVKKSFSVEETLPYANLEYEFRVRIHTGSAAVMSGANGSGDRDMWSRYDIVKIKTLPLPPSVAPRTSLSSFEVIEGLDSREIFVYYVDVARKLRGGADFSYIVDVFQSDVKRSANVRPVVKTNAYFQYKVMNFSQYTFRITPVNEKGRADAFSEVIVPDSDCMPKKTGMFTVITSSEKIAGKIFSLYWVPAQMPVTKCDGAGNGIDSYTVFWCKRSFGHRCKEKLDWERVAAKKLSHKDLTDVSTSRNQIIYERNMTNVGYRLQEWTHGFDYQISNQDMNDLYSFGVAANSGRFSSGIRWSSCIVDESEPPLPPITDVEPLNNDSRSIMVRWSLKCMSISAVPVGFNISYCKSVIEDFGHCDSDIQHVSYYIPSLKQATVSGLDAGFSYIFSVNVMSIIGEGQQSDPKLIKLRSDTPTGKPLDLTVVELTNSSVLLTWKAPKKEDRGGKITDYRITISSNLFENLYVTADDQMEQLSYTVKGLHPFTTYNIFMSVCNAVGCGHKNHASVTFQTLPGTPGLVENLLLDVSNWRLVWDLKTCRSRSCVFEVKVPNLQNRTTRIVTVDDKEILSLRDIGLPCNLTTMSFAVRAKGQDLDGNSLYGDWSKVVKDPLDCPPDFLAWWLIFIIVFFCLAVSILIFLAVKFGWTSVKRAVKECKQSINLPRGIQVAEGVKEPLHEFSFPRESKEKFFSKNFSSSDRNISNGALLFGLNQTEKGKTRTVSNSSNEGLLTGPHDVSNDSAVGFSTGSACSNDINHAGDAIKIGSNGRNSRNFSGSSSDRSSGLDSTVVGEHKDQSGKSETSKIMAQLAKMNPGQGYVLPEQLTTEGYMSALAVPSFPNVEKRAQTGASTDSGIMPDSEGEKDRANLDFSGRNNEVFPVQNCSTNPLNKKQDLALPKFSRHGFIPSDMLSATKGGYFSIDAPTQGYISLNKNSLNSSNFPKSNSEDRPEGAYVRVEQRNQKPSQSDGSPPFESNISSPDENRLNFPNLQKSDSEDRPEGAYTCVGRSNQEPSHSDGSLPPKGYIRTALQSSPHEYLPMMDRTQEYLPMMGNKTPTSDNLLIVVGDKSPSPDNLSTNGLSNSVPKVPKWAHLVKPVHDLANPSYSEVTTPVDSGETKIHPTTRPIISTDSENPKFGAKNKPISKENSGYVSKDMLPSDHFINFASPRNTNSNVTSSQNFFEGSVV